jgi:hypothetical protein
VARTGRVFGGHVGQQLGTFFCLQLLDQLVDPGIELGGCTGLLRPCWAAGCSWHFSLQTAFEWRYEWHYFPGGGCLSITNGEISQLFLILWDSVQVYGSGVRLVQTKKSPH